MRRLPLMVVFTLLLVACIPPITDSPQPVTETVLPPASATPGLDWIQVYFTDPSAPNARDYRGGPDEALVAAIQAARMSVDVAAYNLTLWSVRDALLDAHRRGLQVRMVVESDNLDGDEIQELVAAGIPVVGDRREGLMHNKVVILDHQEVWTGSMNFTVAGGYYDDNDLVRLRSTRVAEAYQHEFEEMFVNDRFGPDSLPDTLYPSLSVDGVDVELYFSPEDPIAARIVELVSTARESIDFMAFSFTADDIGAAILEAATMRGVTVRGLMDEEQVNSNEGTEHGAFLLAGLDVREDGSKGQMHHKVIIIDRSIVITGSYNFSASAANRNDENLIIIFNSQIASQYLEQFQRLYAQAQPAP